MFSFLESGINLSTSSADSFKLENITELHEQFASYLKANCSYFFNNTKGNPMN